MSVRIFLFQFSEKQRGPRDGGGISGGNVGYEGGGGRRRE